MAAADMTAAATTTTTFSIVGGVGVGGDPSDGNDDGDGRRRRNDSDVDVDVVLPRGRSVRVSFDVSPSGRIVRMGAAPCPSPPDGGGGGGGSSPPPSSPASPPSPSSSSVEAAVGAATTIGRERREEDDVVLRSEFGADCFRSSGGGVATTSTSFGGPLRVVADPANPADAGAIDVRMEKGGESPPLLRRFRPAASLPSAAPEGGVRGTPEFASATTILRPTTQAEEAFPEPPPPATPPPHAASAAAQSEEWRPRRQLERLRRCRRPPPPRLAPLLRLRPRSFLPGDDDDDGDGEDSFFCGDGGATNDDVDRPFRTPRRPSTPTLLADAPFMPTLDTPSTHASSSGFCLMMPSPSPIDVVRELDSRRRRNDAGEGGDGRVEDLRCLAQSPDHVGGYEDADADADAALKGKDEKETKRRREKSTGDLREGGNNGKELREGTTDRKSTDDDDNDNDWYRKMDWAKDQNKGHGFDDPFGRALLLYRHRTSTGESGDDGCSDDGSRATSRGSSSVGMKSQVVRDARIFRNGLGAYVAERDTRSNKADGYNIYSYDPGHDDPDNGNKSGGDNVAHNATTTDKNDAMHGSSSITSRTSVVPRNVPTDIYDCLRSSEDNAGTDAARRNSRSSSVQTRLLRHDRYEHIGRMVEAQDRGLDSWNDSTTSSVTVSRALATSSDATLPGALPTKYGNFVSSTSRATTDIGRQRRGMGVATTTAAASSSDATRQQRQQGEGTSTTTRSSSSRRARAAAGRNNQMRSRRRPPLSGLSIIEEIVDVFTPKCCASATTSIDRARRPSSKALGVLVPWHSAASMRQHFGVTAATATAAAEATAKATTMAGCKAAATSTGCSRGSFM